jgi:hypothetical protein
MQVEAGGGPKRGGKVDARFDRGGAVVSRSGSGRHVEPRREMHLTRTAYRDRLPRERLARLRHIDIGRAAEEGS